MSKVFIFTIGTVCVFQLVSLWLCPIDTRRWVEELQEERVVLELVGQVDAVDAMKPTAQKPQPPDGTYNGFDLFYVNAPPRSTVHCVGENFQNDRSWLFRSCEYKTLCFDIDRRDFVIYRDRPMQLPTEWWSSTQMDRNNTNVAGGSQPKTWFPVVAQEKTGLTTRIGRFRPRSGQAPPSYYRFNATMLPFYRHPTSYRNPGHLQWDDFMALYTLLDIFDRVDDRLYLAQMRRPTTDEFQEPIPPFDIIDRFLALMGNHPYNIDITKGYDLKLLNNESKFNEEGKDRVICADHGLTGSGLFSDHGENRWHGQWEADRVLPHNIGRGGLFRRFRRFLMNNIGVSPDNKMERSPYKIIVAQSSSTKWDRANFTFAGEMQALSVLGDRVNVQAVNMTDMSLYEQIEMTSKAAVYVSVVGGGSSTAMFLPKGAHLIMFYRPTKYLDWDFWNNFPHIKVHWIPMWRDEEGRVVNVKYKKCLKLIVSELDLLDALVDE